MFPPPHTHNCFNPDKTFVNITLNTQLLGLRIRKTWGEGGALILRNLHMYMHCLKKQCFRSKHAKELVKMN